VKLALQGSNEFNRDFHLQNGWYLEQAGEALAEFRKTPLYIRAKGQIAINAAYVALFEPGIVRLKLEGVPTSHADGPDYPNVLKVWDLPQLWETLGPRAEVEKP
jgi:hypothetical protein